MLITAQIRRLLTWAITSMIALGFGLGIAQFDFFQTVERKSYDWRVKSLRDAGPKATSALVLIDEKTLSFFKETDGLRWPFPRDIYCPILQYLKAGGARAVAFDIQFSEPDEFDGAFAECIAEANNVVLGIQCQGEPQPAPLALPGTVTLAGQLKGPRCHPLSPMPSLRKAARAVGAIDMEPDKDGVLRHATLLRAHGDRAVVASLGVAAWRVAKGIERAEVVGDTLKMGGKTMPLTADGRLVVRWRRGEQPYPSYSFKKIYANAMLWADNRATPLKPAVFKDRVVFIATSAAGTYEMRVTPLREADYGVHLHAATYEAVSSGSHSRDAHGNVEFVLLLLFTLAVAAATTLVSRASVQVVGVAFLLLTHACVVTWAFHHHGVWLEVVIPTVSMVAAWGFGGVANYLTVGRSQQELRSAFQHYLAPEVVKELVSDPSKLQLGGERRDITAFFSDIQGFTTFSEGMEPGELVAFLNLYLTELTQIITDEGGTIDKYEGDAIIAMFGAPVAHEDHAVRACRAAMRCQARLSELRSSWEARGLPPVHTRIGLNSGLAVVGNMGATFRFDYTMIGDTVNLAARLEGTNKVYGTLIMVGAGTHERAHQAIVMRELDSVQVKGKTFANPVFTPEFVIDATEQERYQLQGFDAATQHAIRESYAEALAHYRAGRFAAAERGWRALSTATSAHPEGDPASAVMAQRAEQLAVEPPEDWDGVFAMTSK